MSKLRLNKSREFRLLFNFAKICLRNHRYNQRELHDRKQYLRDMFMIKSTTDYSSLEQLGCKIQGSPEICAVEKIVEMIDSDATVTRLSRITEAIEDFYDSLDTESQKIIDLYFFEHNSMRQTAEMVNLSFETLRLRRIPQLVTHAMRYLFGGMVGGIAA
jgi:DNA-directed RNA polymerase specialized sigma subunit